MTKDWKVVVGREIIKDAKASPDCTNFMWDMPDLLSGSTDKVWHLQNSGSSYLKIPKTDLQQTPFVANASRVKNDDFGEKNGTIKVTCIDAAGYVYSVYSRNAPSGSSIMRPTVTAKVFFERDDDLAGNSTVTTDVVTGIPVPSSTLNRNQPLWFIFWKEGNVIDLLHDVDYFIDTKINYGLTYPPTSGTAQVTISSRAIRHKVENFSDRDKITNIKFSFGSLGTHAQSLIGCLIHENYHKAVLLEFGWGAVGNIRSGIESDGDALPDNEEIIPGATASSNPNNPSLSSLPHSRINNADTYGLAAIVDPNNPTTSPYVNYGDQDIRCRTLQYNITSSTLWQLHYNYIKDWSAVIENSNW